MLIDSHAHLDMKDFEKDRETVIQRAIQGGLTHIITVGTDLNSSLTALDLTQKFESVYSSLGCHPHNADGCDLRALDQLAKFASEPKVVAWGEIGLDFYRMHSSPEGQVEIFLHQLKLAADLDLPVIIHDREAHDDVLGILKRMGKGKQKGVIHCFSGDIDLAMALIDLGYYISIPGTVTYKKASMVKEVACSLPLERLLVETDAPFLAPEPKRGKRNEPLFVTFTAQEIAGLRKIDFEKMALQTSQNALRLFHLP